jgi:hypothetical protein
MRLFRPLFLLGALLPFPTVPAAEETRHCVAAEHHQFDFWIGDWDVRTPDGRLAGTNHVTSIVDGCGLQEHWTGARGTTGTSLNTYDESRRRWHQTWIDSTGSVLLLDGSFKDGRMILSGSTPSGAGGTTHDRITWERIDAGRVRQLWEQSSDGGATWAVVFDGLYTRRH